MFYRYYWDKGFVQCEDYDDLQEIAQGINPDGYPPFRVEKYIICLAPQCEETVELNDPVTNSCINCGQFYNWSGQQLSHPSNWGEETGERFDDSGRQIS